MEGRPRKQHKPGYNYSFFMKVKQTISNFSHPIKQDEFASIRQWPQQNRYKQLNTDTVLEAIDSNHMLATVEQMPYENHWYNAHCYLCWFQKKLKVSCTCVACGKAHNPVRYKAFHHQFYIYRVMQSFHSWYDLQAYLQCLFKILKDLT